MSDIKKTDWFIELNLVKDKDKIIEWGTKAFPQFSKNKNMMAQLWWTVHEKKLLPELKTFTTVEELRRQLKEFADKGILTDDKGKPKKVWGNIEVLVVGPLGDGRPYFGCERCTRGVDKNVGVCVNDDPKTGHPNEQIDGKMIAFQNWSAGDATDEVIIAFSPNNKQNPVNIVGRVLKLSGSMNIKDGRYTVWEILGNISASSMGGSGAEFKTASSSVKEAVKVDEIDVEEGEAAVLDEPEEYFEGDDFFPEEPKEESAGTDAELRAVIADYDGLVKLFMRSLEKHVGAKQIPVDNMVNFLAVQPQLREKTDSKEIAMKFLSYMKDVEKLITIKSVGGKELLARA